MKNNVANCQLMSMRRRSGKGPKFGLGTVVSITGVIRPLLLGTCFTVRLILCLHLQVWIVLSQPLLLRCNNKICLIMHISS